MALVLPEGLDLVAGEDSPGATLNGCQDNVDSSYALWQILLSSKAVHLVSGGLT